MLPSSLIVLLATLFLLVVGLAAFAWAWRRGQFDELEQQSRVIFSDRDYRLERPWESERQRTERRARHGRLEPPAPGEWGDAW